MAETDASDAMLDAFNRKVIARQNLRSLDAADTSKKEAGKSAPSEDEEAEKPPFKPG